MLTQLRWSVTNVMDFRSSWRQYSHPICLLVSTHPPEDQCTHVSLLISCIWLYSPKSPQRVWSEMYLAGHPLGWFICPKGASVDAVLTKKAPIRQGSCVLLPETSAESENIRQQLSSAVCGCYWPSWRWLTWTWWITRCWGHLWLLPLISNSSSPLLWYHLCHLLKGQ